MSLKFDNILASDISRDEMRAEIGKNRNHLFSIIEKADNSDVSMLEIELQVTNEMTGEITLQRYLLSEFLKMLDAAKDRLNYND